jgi:hypothetical protein
MKKTVITVVLFALISALICSCASSSGYESEGDPIAQAARKIYESHYYCNQFEFYIKEEENRVDNIASGKPTAPPVEFPFIKPDWIQVEQPSERSIDLAIEAYEAVLKLYPNGAWILQKNYEPSKNKTNLPRGSYSPPGYGEIHRSIDIAQNKKLAGLKWLSEIQKKMDAVNRQKQAIVKTAADEQQRATQAAAERTRPLRDNDFKVTQNKNNTISITGFNFTEREELVIPEKLYGLRVTEIGDNIHYGKDKKNRILRTYP